MAKKIKPKSLLESSVPEQFDSSDSAMNSPEMNAIVSEEILCNKSLTPELREKLEKYDAMEQMVAELSREKAMLQEKIEEYIAQLANNNDDEVNELRKKNADLQLALDEEKKKSAELADLKRNNELLREENDQYLMKISELTFDNANMTCQLNELSKTMKTKHQTVENQSEFKPKPGVRVDTSRLGQPLRNPYNPYANNGYGSW